MFLYCCCYKDAYEKKKNKPRLEEEENLLDEGEEGNLDDEMQRMMDEVKILIF